MQNHQQQQQLSQKEIFKKILSTLRKDKYSLHFRDPVDWEGLGLWDYRDKVKNPMDLGTMSKNISKYNNQDDFFSDLNLIWENCKAYNIPDSQIYQNAEYYQKKSNELRKKYFGKKHTSQKKKEKLKEKNNTKLNNFGSGNLLDNIMEKNDMIKEGNNQILINEQQQPQQIQEKSQIEVEQKLNLAYMVKNSSDDQLIMFIKGVLDQCPDALKYRGDQLNINVSNIDQQTALNCETIFNKQDQNK